MPVSYTHLTKKNPSGLTVTMGHKMLNPKDSRYYQGIIGGKTGYTSKAGNTLVTAAERNGVRLIAVVMKSQSTHYTDTKALPVSYTHLDVYKRQVQVQPFAVRICFSWSVEEYPVRFPWAV